MIADPDNFFDEIVVSSDLENVLGKGLLKIGVSIIGFFITCLGYFIGFILGIVGMCQKNKKKLYSLLGLSFSIAAPIFFVIIGIFTMLFALV
ncbi:MAG: hypothetical protein LRY71_06250 [Bacillaceae bacterium]|nr:hypothetical protein [Bacillaceae bacterium]